jgi:hypothetical protein
MPSGRCIEEASTRWRRIARRWVDWILAVLYAIISSKMGALCDLCSSGARNWSSIGVEFSWRTYNSGAISCYARLELICSTRSPLHNLNNVCRLSLSHERNKEYHDERACPWRSSSSLFSTMYKSIFDSKTEDGHLAKSLKQHQLSLTENLVTWTVRSWTAQGRKIEKLSAETRMEIQFLQPPGQLHVPAKPTTLKLKR